MKKNVVIIYGGKSAEHDVSLKTALTVINSMDKERYNLYALYISRQGHWHSLGKIDCEVADVRELEPQQHMDQTIAASMGDILIRYFATTETNIVFPVIHGTHGEDGTLQGLLELMNVPYVGNGVLTSAVGMDKVLTKEVLSRAGIDQATYLSILLHEWETDKEQIVQQIEEGIGYPAYVKPANLGSSVGINRCINRQTLQRAMEEAFRYDRKVVIEQEVLGREVQVAVIGNDHPLCSIAGEFIREQGFFDYKEKYGSGHLIQRIPAQISEEVYEQIKQLACRAFTALDGAGLMRVDFFVTEQNHIYLNEVNTLPGFTKISMFPVLWEKTDGTTYSQLIDTLVDLALERYEQKQTISYGRELV